MDKGHCKLCHEEIPEIVIYTLNRIATERGFCSWFCLSAKLSYAKAMKIIKQERIKRMQVATGLDSQGKPHQDAYKGQTKADR